MSPSNRESGREDTNNFERETLKCSSTMPSMETEMMVVRGDPTPTVEPFSSKDNFSLIRRRKQQVAGEEEDEGEGEGGDILVAPMIWGQQHVQEIVPSKLVPKGTPLKRGTIARVVNISVDGVVNAIGSSITSIDLDKYHQMYEIPVRVAMREPLPNEVACLDSSPEVCFYEHMFQ